MLVGIALLGRFCCSTLEIQSVGQSFSVSHYLVQSLFEVDDCATCYRVGIVGEKNGLAEFSSAYIGQHWFIFTGVRCAVV